MEVSGVYQAEDTQSEALQEYYSLPMKQTEAWSESEQQRHEVMFSYMVYREEQIWLHTGVTYFLHTPNVKICWYQLPAGTKYPASLGNLMNFLLD